IPVHLLRGEDETFGERRARGRLLGEVGGGVDEQLEGRRRASLGGALLRGHGRQVTPGAVAGDGYAPGVDAQLAGAGDGVAEGGERVLYRSRERILGREAVVDAEDGCPRRRGQQPAGLIGGVEIA